MVNTYHKQKGHKFLTNLTNSEYLAFLYSDHTKKSTDTDEASNTAETKTKECKIELSDNGILVDGETISENTEDSVYAGADIVYYKEGQDSTYGAGDEDDGHSEEEAAEHTVITITIDMVILTGFAVGAEVVQGILTGFIKLQIRLLSIDKQNSYAIIAGREK